MSASSAERCPPAEPPPTATKPGSAPYSAPWARGQVVHQGEPLGLAGADHPAAAVHVEEDRAWLRGRSARPVEVQAQVHRGRAPVADAADALDAGLADRERHEDLRPIEPRREPRAQRGVDAFEVVGAQALDQRAVHGAAGLETAQGVEDERRPRGQRDAEPEAPRPGVEGAEGDEDRRRDALPEDVVQRQLAGEPAQEERHRREPRAGAQRTEDVPDQRRADQTDEQEQPRHHDAPGTQDGRSR